MMPEKLYIPTSTLNFNNLMSSESISPASFYLRRGFGYKRFEKVDPNPLNNRIILYEEFPVYEIHDTELENYPMVIEIDSRNVNEDIIKENNGVYFVEETIYLNPFTTKFIFRNNQEKVSTLSKAEPSIESKMVALYSSCFITPYEYKDFKTIQWLRTEIEDSNADISLYISKDRKINKLKGLLYAYLIASNKSISPDIVSLKKLARTLKNILSAIITSPDRRATYAQEEQLKTLYNSINERLQKILIAPIIKEKSEKYQCDFYFLLTQENLWESWLRQNNFSKFQVSPFYASSKEKDVAFNNYIQNLENLLSGIEDNQKRQMVNTTSLPFIQNWRIINLTGQKEFLMKLFNEYLDEVYNSDEFIQSRYEFAKSGGKVFKDELQEQWNGSQWQQYINGLLKNLNEYSAFDLKSINNTTLESFAAFCQKGESDIDKLEDYLIINEIGDFRIAFSLWGIVFGFANMPKTLTNKLFLSENMQYTSEVYSFIFKQIHGIDIEGKMEEKSKRQKEVLKEFHNICTPIDQDASQDMGLYLIEINTLRERLKDCKLRSKQLESIDVLYKNNDFIINDRLFAEILKIDFIGEKTIRKIKNVLNYKDTQAAKPIKKAEPTLFGDKKPDIAKEFIKDPNVWLYIEDLLPAMNNIRKQVKIDLDWFQGNYSEVYNDRKKGNIEGYFFKRPKDNRFTILHYEQYLRNKLSGDQGWLINIYKKVDIDRIIHKLRDLYLKNG